MTPEEFYQSQLQFHKENYITEAPKNNDREIIRLEKLKKTNADLLGMLGNEAPNYFEKQILENLDSAIALKEKLTKS